MPDMLQAPRAGNASPQNKNALAHAQTPATGFMAAAAGYAKARQSSFGTQELLRFLGAFRRAGGDAEAYAEMTSRQQELRYDFPALGGLQVTLQAATPGQPSRTRRRVRAAALREQSELKGDPQRADGGTTGVALWEASFVLAEWLSRQGDGQGGLLACSALQELLKGAGKAQRARWRRWRGKVGVELGAGLGLPSIVASQLGARVVATDGDASVLTLLRQNVEENRGSGTLRAEALLWGSEDPLSKIGLDERPDFLLAADVIYASAKEALGRQLLDTLLKLSKPDTVIIISNVRRFREAVPPGRVILCGEKLVQSLDKTCWRPRQSRPGPFHHLAQWGGRLLACDTENLIHQATDRDSWACTFNSIEHHFRHDHPVIHAMSPSTRWRDVLRTDVSWKLGAFLRVVGGYVSVDWLHEIEGFQHFFRCGDVFQVFSAWVQWLQLYYWMYIFWMMSFCHECGDSEIQALSGPIGLVAMMEFWQTMERGQALEMQGRHDEAAGQAEKLHSMLFFLTAATALFTPVQFMSSVYGMNFVNVEGVPTIPMLLEKSGYERFWIGVTAYFALAFACTGWIYRRLQRKSGKQMRRKAAPLPACCCCCPR
eukprot:s2406_g5.t1